MLRLLCYRCLGVNQQYINPGMKARPFEGPGWQEPWAQMKNVTRVTERGKAQCKECKWVNQK